MTFKFAILWKLKKLTKHAKRHLYVWFNMVLTSKCLANVMPFAKI